MSHARERFMPSRGDIAAGLPCDHQVGIQVHAIPWHQPKLCKWFALVDRVSIGLGDFSNLDRHEGSLDRNIYFDHSTLTSLVDASRPHS